MAAMILRLRSAVTTPRGFERLDLTTKWSRSHWQSVGQSKPSLSSRITSLGLGGLVGGLEEHTRTFMSGLFATRQGLDTITAG